MSLAAAARLANLCPQYFCSYFRERVGVSFTIWQNAERTDHARKLLLNEGTRISAAAEASGYTNASSFARAFKLYQGVTARQLLGLLRRQPELAPALRLADSPKLVLQLSLIPPTTVVTLRAVSGLLRRLGSEDAAE